MVSWSQIYELCVTHFLQKYIPDNPVQEDAYVLDPYIPGQGGMSLSSLLHSELPNQFVPPPTPNLSLSQPQLTPHPQLTPQWEVPSVQTVTPTSSQVSSTFPSTNQNSQCTGFPTVYPAPSNHSLNPTPPHFSSNNPASVPNNNLVFSHNQPEAD